ncbi:glycosyltransferase [Portibacter marinus]|uniref:glycosyltransferase n=1 Tax=Portibacter marinus TaxID=2898660 RepID=UPI001F3DB10F|nr:glycosyltransferase [Portibacter marinus]
MRLAYIYQEGTNIKKANIYQSYSMVKAFGQRIKVDWYRGYSKMKWDHPQSNVNQIRVINPGLQKFEKWSRLIFCFNVCILLHLRPPTSIFTRDFAFIYFYSKIPQWARVKAPIIFESHKIYSEVSDKVTPIQESKAYSVVHNFVAVSEGIKEDLQHYFDVEENRIAVLPNGIDTYPLDAMKQRNPGEINYVYAGSYGTWKGVDVIVAAAKILQSFPVHHALKIHIYIIGVSSNDLNTHRLDNITVIPSLDKKDLYKFYAKMDVGLVPTLNRMEGTKYTSPIKLFEYAYAGLEILASDIPSIRELESKGLHINFFNVGDPQSLAEQMATLPTKKEDAIKNNQNLVHNYTWQNRADQIFTALQA